MTEHAFRGRVDAVCVVFEERKLAGPARFALKNSAIDKRPVDGRVAVRELGLDGDHVCDPKHHGGSDQAVYAYAAHEALRWARELGRELPAGWFGENLRVSGIEVTGAVVGERWAVGTDGLVLEVTIPRVPCLTFARWSEEDRWVRRFANQGDVGAYLRVVAEGTVAAGDRIDVVSRPEHGVTARGLFDGSAGQDGLRRLLAAEDLPAKVARDARARLVP
ncbi:MAG: MOSC domain-containing protein [Segniliparus sp.]|uniref:MOSC domain-containing protein n=1 Tax=Segniliparus sp. TaxID=2804064 RepID=UPI003F399838